MEKTNADYIIDKLKKFNIPFPRRKMSIGQLDRIKAQLDEIEGSIEKYREILENYPSSTQ